MNLTTTAIQNRKYLLVTLALVVVALVGLPACTQDIDHACDRWCSEGRACGADLSDDCEHSCATAEDHDFADKVNACTDKHGCDFTSCVD